MNILLSYASEYDKGEGMHFARVFRRLGHPVTEINVAATATGTGSPGSLVRGYPADTTVTELIDDCGGADFFLYLEPQALIPRGLERSPIPTACVFSDTHRNVKAHRTVASLFDFVFSYMPNYLTAYSDHVPGTVHWLPYGCDEQFFRDAGRVRDLEVAFVGRLYTKERRRVVGALQRRFRLNQQRYYLQGEIPEIYSRAQIVVDLPVADTMHFRIFEALSCGALLLIKRVNGGIERLFKEGTHYEGYGSDEELFAKIEFYLANPAERDKIARAGYEEVMREHTLSHRLAWLLRTVHSGPLASAPVRRAGIDGVLRVYSDVYERAGRIEVLLKMAAEQRGSRRRHARLIATAAKSFVRRVVLGW
jgi:hypothetical protein